MKNQFLSEKETLLIIDRLFMGQFLISNKDRGTIVTPSQPHTGTEVQVHDTHRDEFKTHGTISCFTENNARKNKKGDSVPPNDEMTTSQGSLAFFGQQNPTNLSERHIFFYKVLLAVVVFFSFNASFFSKISPGLDDL